MQKSISLFLKLLQETNKNDIIQYNAIQKKHTLVYESASIDLQNDIIQYHAKDHSFCLLKLLQYNTKQKCYAKDHLFRLLKLLNPKQYNNRQCAVQYSTVQCNTISLVFIQCSTTDHILASEIQHKRSHCTLWNAIRLLYKSINHILPFPLWLSGLKIPTD